jgi:hypothetical protein
LEPEPFALLGNTTAHLAHRRWLEEICIGSTEELMTEIEKAMKIGL